MKILEHFGILEYFKWIFFLCRLFLKFQMFFMATWFRDFKTFTVAFNAKLFYSQGFSFVSLLSLQNRIPHKIESQVKLKSIYSMHDHPTQCDINAT